MRQVCRAEHVRRHRGANVNSGFPRGKIADQFCLAHSQHASFGKAFVPTGIPRILSCNGDHTHKCLKALEKEELRQNTTRGENHCKIMKYRAGARKKAAQGRAGGSANSLRKSESYSVDKVS